MGQDRVFWNQISLVGKWLSLDKQMSWAKGRMAMHLAKYPIEHPLVSEIFDRISVENTDTERESIELQLTELRAFLYTGEFDPAKVLMEEGAVLLAQLNSPVPSWILQQFCLSLIWVREAEVGSEDWEAGKSEFMQGILDELYELL